MRVWRRPSGPLSCHATVGGSPGAETFAADLKLSDATGVVAEVERLLLRRSDPARVTQRPASSVPWLYEVDWRPHENRRIAALQQRVDLPAPEDVASRLSSEVERLSASLGLSSMGDFIARLEACDPGFALARAVDDLIELGGVAGFEDVSIRGRQGRIVQQSMVQFFND